MFPSQELIEKYAKLIVKVGANVQPGQYVRLQASVDMVPLAASVSKECYKAGACKVDIIWDCDETDKINYTYADKETLGKVRKWEEEFSREMTELYPVRIFIESSDPDAMDGIDSELLTDVTRMRKAVIKKYRDAIDGKHQWLIVAAAGKKWAKKVFPDLTEDEAETKLWDAIFKCVRLYDSDPVSSWKMHVKDMTEKAKWLNSQEFRSLRYKSSNGTDFRVGLMENSRFVAADEFNILTGTEFVPNMPTEEVFISPKAGDCDGRLVAVKPLTFSGKLVENFYIDYKNGRAVSCHAEKGQDVLEKMLAIDEGAGMLGELALVPKESPVNKSGLLFYNILFDENACCHVAAGKGFAETVTGYENMTKEELSAKGLNDSLIHSDYMIGADDLDITGIKADGTEVPVFRGGTWAK